LGGASQGLLLQADDVGSCCYAQRRWHWVEWAMTSSGQTHRATRMIPCSLEDAHEPHVRAEEASLTDCEHRHQVRQMLVGTSSRSGWSSMARSLPFSVNYDDLNSNPLTSLLRMPNMALPRLGAMEPPSPLCGSLFVLAQLERRCPAAPSGGEQ
jgi:hypothetical protein